MRFGINLAGFLFGNCIISISILMTHLRQSLRSLKRRELCTLHKTRKTDCKIKVSNFHCSHIVCFTFSQKRQTIRSCPRLFSRGDHVGAHLICGAPAAAIKFKIQGRVNEPASRRNRYSNVRRSHINIYGKFAETKQRRGRRPRWNPRTAR